MPDQIETSATPGKGVDDRQPVGDQGLWDQFAQPSDLVNGAELGDRRAGGKRALQTRCREQTSQRAR